MPLTNAEKQARWRERREQRYTERAMRVVGLEERIAEQQAEIERLRNQPSPAAAAAPLRARIEELEKELAEWRKAGSGWEELAQQFDALRAGCVFSREEYKRIAACLHPDRVVGTELEKKYAAAFSLFSGAEKLLVKWEPKLRPGAAIPRTAAEWAAAKRAHEAEKKRKRAAAKAAKEPKRQLRNHAEV
jgi:colicin import membrane protein